MTKVVAGMFGLVFAMTGSVWWQITKVSETQATVVGWLDAGVQQRIVQAARRDMYEDLCVAGKVPLQDCERNGITTPRRPPED